MKFNSDQQPLAGIFLMGEPWFDTVYPAAVRAQIARQMTLTSPLLTARTFAATLPRLRGTEIIFGGWDMPPITPEVLDALPRLQAVFYAGGSVRQLVCESFWQREITLSSALHANAVPVAEYTLAAIFFCLKDLFRLERTLRTARTWPERPSVAGAYKSTIGLVSMGMTARILRERLLAFDLNIITYDPFLDPSEAERLNVSCVSLEELFTQADIVSLHTPWLDETEGMIQGAHFAMMKQGAAFINTARGAIIRENEMIAVLKQRPDLFAVLDVTYPEPPAASSPLYTMPNVFMTPHMAGSWGRELTRLGVYMADEFERYVNGEPLLWRITRDQMARMA